MRFFTHIFLVVLLASGMPACKHTHSRVAEQQATASQKADAPLTNTLWKLIQIDGKPVPPQEGEIRLRFPDAKQFLGTTGCNDYSGGYDLEDTSLALRSITATEKACDNIKVEQRYFRLLGEVETYQIKGDTLTLSSSGEVLLMFEALYLR